MTLIKRLFAVIDAYRASRGLSEGRVSTLVFGDGMKLSRLRSGADLTTTRFEAAMRWFSENWPEGARWPSDVPRPTKSDERGAA